MPQSLCLQKFFTDALNHGSSNPPHGLDPGFGEIPPTCERHLLFRCGTTQLATQSGARDASALTSCCTAFWYDVTAQSVPGTRSSWMVLWQNGKCYLGWARIFGGRGLETTAFNEVTLGEVAPPCLACIMLWHLFPLHFQPWRPAPLSPTTNLFACLLPGTWHSLYILSGRNPGWHI